MLCTDLNRGAGLLCLLLDQSISVGMDTQPSLQFKSAADSVGIRFSPEIFNCDATMNQTQAQSQSTSKGRDQVVLYPKAFKVSTRNVDTRNDTPNRQASKDTKSPQRQGLVHPALRRQYSGSAGDVAALDDVIARNGGITSTYEQLPHRLRASKKGHPTTAEERVIELTRTNGYLLQELAYYKDTGAADTILYEKVIDLHASLDDALKERSQKRADAERALLSYWGIDFGDGNIENKVF